MKEDRIGLSYAEYPTGSPDSVKAYEEFCELVAEEVPYIIWNRKVISLFPANVVLNYEGTVAYYWNTYFTK